MARLSEEFGVASVEDALSLLADLERQIEAALGAIDTQLAAAGEVDEIVQCSAPSR
jgi:enamine deaminase RidA (YjgF/YER057c/UK114 family)